MKLICTINGAEVEADGRAADKLIASGSFAKQPEKKPQKKKAAAKE